jgi:hypothetical protein
LSASHSLAPLEAEGKVLWAGGEPSALERSQMAFLLPPYDEYLMGYKDRSRALDPAYDKRVNAGGGMPKPTIVVNGEVVGTWKRRISPDRIVVTAEWFRGLDQDERTAVETAVRRYGDFNSLSAVIE